MSSKPSKPSDAVYEKNLKSIYVRNESKKKIWVSIGPEYNKNTAEMDTKVPAEKFKKEKTNQVKKSPKDCEETQGNKGTENSEEDKSNKCSSEGKIDDPSSKSEFTSVQNYYININI